MDKLGRAAAGATLAVWIARLSTHVTHDRGNRTAAAATPRADSYAADIFNICPKLNLRTSCCNCGFEDVIVEVDNEEIGTTDSSGALQFPPLEARQQLLFELKGVPSCLLPGYTTEYIAQIRQPELAVMELKTMCHLWIYWLPPDNQEQPPKQEDDEVYADDFECPDDSELVDSIMPGVQGSAVLVCANEAQIPYEAKPLKGMLHCPGAVSGGEIRLDGQSMGPYAVCPASSAPRASCLLARARLSIEPPKGYSYQCKEPSPFATRCRQLGGCELQRLARSPVVVGFLQPITTDTANHSIC